MNTSMRTRSIIALVVAGIAIPAAPAVASPLEPFGADALVASQQGAGQSGSEDQGSVNALVGDSTSTPSPAAIPEHNLTSLNAVVGGEPQSSPSQSAPVTSLNAVVGGEPQSSPSQSAHTTLTSLNAVVGPEPQASPSQSALGGSDYSSVGALVGDQTPPASPTPVASSIADGFDWLDALFGAVAGIGLLGLMIVAARSVTRHRQRTAESRA